MDRWHSSMMTTSKNSGGTFGLQATARGVAAVAASAGLTSSADSSSASPRRIECMRWMVEMQTCAPSATWPERRRWTL